ncbi:MAG: squalene/phytoene synthase family protein [Phycisphaeraceae bacterium]|nr:squalene/phytoene synthase family protein [Phycisphaeraceae bacterium]
MSGPLRWRFEVVEGSCGSDGRVESLAASSSTLELLGEFGPEAPAREAPRAAESLAYCRRLARKHEENFPVLSRLLPAELVDPFAAVYAFCRWSDDLGDELGADAAAREKATGLLGWWRRETVAWGSWVEARRAGGALEGDGARAGAGRPWHPVFVALAEVSRDRPLPVGPMLDLIDAFEQDQRVTRYETWEELVDYCSRSANPVGRLVLAIGGVGDAGARLGGGSGKSDRDEHGLELGATGLGVQARTILEQSDALCTALQLTNFWQDVRRDLVDRDRIYLPRRETGFDEATLRDFMARSEDPRARVPYIRAVRRLVERTRGMFDASAGLAGIVPREIATPVGLFHSFGRATLRQIDATGCTTLWARPRLSRSAKARLLVRALVMSRVRRYRESGRAGRGAASRGSDAGERGARV